MRSVTKQPKAITGGHTYLTPSTSLSPLARVPATEDAVGDTVASCEPAIVVRGDSVGAKDESFVAPPEREGEIVRDRSPDGTVRDTVRDTVWDNEGVTDNEGDTENDGDTDGVQLKTLLKVMEPAVPAAFAAPPFEALAPDAATTMAAR